MRWVKLERFLIILQSHFHAAGRLSAKMFPELGHAVPSECEHDDKIEPAEDVHDVPEKDEKPIALADYKRARGYAETGRTRSNTLLVRSSSPAAE